MTDFPFADRIRHALEFSTMAVGNISSYADVNTILASGRADLCLLARAHLQSAVHVNERCA